MILRSFAAIGCASALAMVGSSAQGAPRTSTPDLLAAAVVLPHPYPQSRFDGPDLSPGVARTAIDRRFEHGKADAAFGFLCGRPGDRTGQAARVIGDDPHGRFLGARLSLAIR